MSPVEAVLRNTDLLDLIFDFLSPDTVKTTRLVCRVWRAAIEKAKWWRWARLRVSSSSQAAVMGSRLVEIVPEIKINDELSHLNRIRLVGEVFQALGSGHLPRLQRLQFRATDLSSLSPDLLTSVTRLREASFMNCQLNAVQLTAILTAISQAEELQLKHLDVYGNSLTEVKVDTLAGAAARLDTLIAGETELGSERVEDILRSILAMEDLRLKKLTILTLHRTILPQISPAVLSAAQVKLESSDLQENHHSSDLKSFALGMDPGHIF